MSDITQADIERTAKEWQDKYFHYYPRESMEYLRSIAREYLELARVMADYNQRCHDMKQLRDAMGCDGSDLTQLLAKWRNVQEQLQREKGINDSLAHVMTELEATISRRRRPRRSGKDLR